MNGQAVPIVAIVGRSKVGKTTFIEKLIPRLSERGVKVATIKHHHLDFEIDREGKDTYRHRKAGARTTIISSPRKIALIEDVEQELSLEEILSRFVRSADILIAEGYKKEQIPKIEFYVRKEGQSPVCMDDANLVAIVTDEKTDMPIPHFSTDDASGVADFIIARFIHRRLS